MCCIAVLLVLRCVRTASCKCAPFAQFQVNHELMKLAEKEALFMHCLPAHRGEEVSEELLEDESISVVWNEAENRLHAQKALMEFLVKSAND